MAELSLRPLAFYPSLAAEAGSSTPKRPVVATESDPPVGFLQSGPTLSPGLFAFRFH